MMRSSVRLLLAIWGLCLVNAALAAPGSVSLHFQKVNNFPVKYVAVKLTDPDVTIATALAPRFPRGLDTWGNFLGRLQPDAAINGTYFCLRTNMPVGDVATEGQLCYKGVVGTALCITPDNRVVMRPGPYAGKTDWTGFRTVLTAGPRLLTEGQVTIDARREGFRDPRVLGSAPRSAAALRADGTLLLLTIQENISLMNLACVCLHLGATDAMALDGGNSSGLYAEGRSVTKPGRGLSNILVVYASRAKYQQYARHIIPSGAPILADLLPPAFRPVLAAWQPARPASSAEVMPVSATVPARPALAMPTLRLAQPNPAVTVQGTVPIVIEINPDAPPQSVTLRINGRLRAIANVWPMVYHWDSTQDDDGLCVVEATAWRKDRTVMARDACTYRVANQSRLAANRR